MSTAPYITIFVRHAPDCKYAGDEFSKRCDCKKHMRWTMNGKQYRKAANARSWAEAETAKRDVEDQLNGKPPAVVDAEVKTIEECVRLFLKDKAVQGFTKANLSAYTHQLNRLASHFLSQGVLTVGHITRESLTDYCALWPAWYPSGATRYRVRARHNSFFKFCFDCRWIDRTPKMPKMAEPESETMPLTAEEFDRLLTAVGSLRIHKNKPRVRALFLLQRWSGLAIRDALTLAKSQLVLKAPGRYNVVTERKKTGTPVSVPIPLAVANELLALAGHPEHFFWDGKQDEYLLAVCTGQLVKRVFVAAGLDDGQHMKSHRLRDTFAVELLTKGVPMEEVSKLLGHTSIRTTEKHYAKWVKGRQDRLDSLVTATWAA